MTQVNNERLEAKTQSIELVKRIESAKSSDLATAEHKFSQIRENHNTTIRRVFEALPPDLKKLQKLSKSLADRPENSLPDSSIKSEIQNTRLSLAVQLSESLTSDGEKALQRAADLLDSASEFAKNGDTARAKTRVEFSKRIQGFVEAQAGKSLSERTDVDGFNRGTVAEVAYELYDTANELDKSGSPASGDLVLEHAQFLMNAATFALRLFPVVDSVLSTIEAASGRTVDYNSFGEPYFRETTTIERSFALAQVGLTAAGALLGGPAGVLAAGTLFDIGKAIGKREGKVLAKQAAESAFAKGLGKAEQEVAESAAKETAEQAAEQLGKEAEKVLDSAKNISRQNPINPGVLHNKPIRDIIPLDSRGVPLPNSTIADTFRGGSYLTIETKNPVTLYRAYSDPSRKFGPYWSRMKPTGPRQAVMDSALDPTWGNRASEWIEVSLPSGSVMHEGAVASVSNIPAGVELIGGGNQIYLDGVTILDSWITGRGSF